MDWRSRQVNHTEVWLPIDILHSTALTFILILLVAQICKAQRSWIKLKGLLFPFYTKEWGTAGSGDPAAATHISLWTDRERTFTSAKGEAGKGNGKF